MDSSTLQQAQDSRTQFKEHIIKKGETLSGIAVKHHVTVEELMEWNHLENDKIFEGNTLIIKKK